MTRARHLTGQILVAAAILAVICAVAALLIVRSGWFRELVRERIVSEIEGATGGRVEVGNFSFKWETLTAKISPLVLHGTEAESETPLLRAESVSVGLRVISMLERKVDLDSVSVDQPRLRIVIYPDGSNNLPAPPGPKSGRSWAENFVNLKVHRYSVTNGVADIDIRQVPLSFNGEDLRVQMTRDAAAARYRGNVASRRLRIASNIMAPAEADFAAAFTLDGTRLALPSVQIAVGSSRIDLAGELTNLKAPRGDFKAKSVFAVRDAVSLFSLPVASTGTANFDGDLNFSFVNAFDYVLAGRIDARGLGYSQDRVRIQNATLSAAVNLNPDRLTLRGLQGTALGAKVTGQAELEHWKDFHFDGTFDGLDVREAMATLTPHPFPWNGSLAGTLDVDAVVGEREAVVDTEAAIQGQIAGRLSLHYDQRAGTVNFGESRIATPTTSLNLSGTLGQNLDVRARSTNLDDVLPALGMFSDTAPASLPLKLDPSKQGEVAVAGLVSGRLDAPQFQGQVTVTNASVEGHAFDRFAADVQASAQAIALRRLMLTRAQTQVTGDAVVGATAGNFMDGPLTAQLSVKNLQLAASAREFGIATVASVDADALASATVKLSGSARRPEADIVLDAAQATALGEKFERVRANVRYTALSIAFNTGQADLGTGKLLFSGAYTHQDGDLHSGDLRVDATAQAITASRVAALRQLEPGAEGRLDGKATVDIHIDRGALLLRAVSGEASARGVTLDKQKLGDISLTAVGSSRVDLQACKLEYSIVSPK